MGTVASFWEDVRHMHAEHPSSWLVAWSRVKTARSRRVRAYLQMSGVERRRRYRWLYRN